MKPLYKQFENAAPVGVYPMSNFGGLAILAIDDGYQNIRRHKIHYSALGRPYIRKNGTRFYFDQIVRYSA